MPLDTQETMTAPEAARLLGLTPSAVYAAVQRGVLTFLPLPEGASDRSVRRLRRVDVLAYAQRNRRTVNDADAAEELKTVNVSFSPEAVGGLLTAAIQHPGAWQLLLPSLSMFALMGKPEQLEQMYQEIDNLAKDETGRYVLAPLIKLLESLRARAQAALDHAAKGAA